MGESIGDEGGAVLKPDSPALAIQRAYWSPDPNERAGLNSRDIASLSWSELLRLHHLNCIEYLWEGGDRAAWRLDEESDAPKTETPALARCGETAQRLRAPESPYRARHCSLFKGENAGPEPDLQGETRNASLTHLGALEVIRLDSQLHPQELAFVALDDLRAVVFASPSLFRAAKLFYDDGRPDEIVLVPLLYAWTWLTRNEILRSGRLTRLFGYTPVGDESIGVGLGHQDFYVASGSHFILIGFGSVRELAVVLEADDSRFEAKCRARGADPDEIRRAMAAQGEGG